MNFKIARFAAVLLLGLAVLVTGCEDPKLKKVKEEASANRASRAYPVAAVDGTIVIGPLKSKLPHGWSSVLPANPMRVAQFELPAVQGDPETGVISVFFFGPQAGSIDENIERWHSQFQQPDGGSTAEVSKREDFEVGGMPVTLVRFSGMMLPSAMPGATQTQPLTGWMNLSAIVTTPEGFWYFKGIGPVNTMRAQEKAMREFLESMSYCQMCASAGH